MTRVFIDINILMDILEERHPHYIHSAELLKLCRLKKIRGFVSANSFSVIYYLLNKKKGHKKAIDDLNTLKKIVSIVPIGTRNIEKSLKSNFSDFEDAIQYYCALDAKADSIITHNKKDFKHSEIPVLNPLEFLSQTL